MRGLSRFLLWLLPAALLSCSTLFFDEGENKIEKVKEPPRPTVNHAAHLGREIECIDCHDPEETGEPRMPQAETCFECHENLKEENERVRAYFDSAKQKDGTYKFTRPAFWPDLIPNHKGHAKYEVDCESCHGKPSDKAFARPDPVQLMDTCMSCHTKKNAANECATCHMKTRKDQKPPDHNPASFLGTHGKKAPEGWMSGEGRSCAFCHSVPDACHTCHRTHKPASHTKGKSFRFNHGRGDYATLDAPFPQTSCALCHKEESCDACHQREQPRNHTEPFKRRLHGLQAEIERQSCQTCHKQDWCQRCHQSEQPVNHRGTWSTGQQSHCIACHDPLSSTGCYTCHKNTLGHLAAPAKPVDANHTGASDPTACENCHQVLPHLNDGGRCGRCHR